MLFRTLDHLREKPEATRHAVALFAALGITGIIVLVWVSVLIARFESAATSTQEREVRGSAGAAETSFSDSAAEAYDALIKERIRSNSQ